MATGLIIIISIIFSIFKVFGDKQCFNIINETIDESFDFTSHTDGLYLNGTKFNLKAASWFGFETCDYTMLLMNLLMFKMKRLSIHNNQSNNLMSDDSLNQQSQDFRF